MKTISKWFDQKIAYRQLLRMGYIVPLIRIMSRAVPLTWMKVSSTWKNSCTTWGLCKSYLPMVVGADFKSPRWKWQRICMVGGSWSDHADFGEADWKIVNGFGFQTRPLQILNQIQVNVMQPPPENEGMSPENVQFLKENSLPISIFQGIC